MSRSRLLEITTGSGQRVTIDLRTLLDPERAERAAVAANAWIKELRNLPVDSDAQVSASADGGARRHAHERTSGHPTAGAGGDAAGGASGHADAGAGGRAAAGASGDVEAGTRDDGHARPLRDRFIYRGDSLWWFAELYLHKQGVVQDLWETALALDALAARERTEHERPVRVRVLGGDEGAGTAATAATSTTSTTSASPEATAGANPRGGRRASAADIDPVLALLLPQAAARFGFRLGDDGDEATNADGGGARQATTRSDATPSDVTRSEATRSEATRSDATGSRAEAGSRIGTGPHDESESVAATFPSPADLSNGNWPAAVRLDRVRWRTALLSRLYTWTALASRLHPRRLFATRAPMPQGGVLAFVHSAFWRQASGLPEPRGAASASRAAGTSPASIASIASSAAGTSDSPILSGVSDASAPRGASSGSAPAPDGEEGYIGAVLRELRTRGEAAPLRLVGVGPRTNFRARRWWHPVRSNLIDPHGLPLTPIEDIASWSALAGSRRVWRERLVVERALLGSAALRAHARIEGYDVWPVIAGELRGVARLQFPWSARAMDEAAAALDACRPHLIVTYAEAGGWGRALMLEARRRGIPSVGLQHGFIYRHWLNYQHATDEMQPSPHNAGDRGFPRPDLTLVYDEGAARHLIAEGRFPADAIQVTGSPSLDALAAAVSAVTDDDRARVRARLGAAEGERLVLVVSKFTQIAAALPALVAAVGDLDDVRLVIKPHPAETAGPYERLAGRAPRVTIAPPALSLAALLASARLLVTVNSTVAIDAMPLGVPALVVLLPNNLSPFVQAGAMAGVTANITARGTARVSSSVAAGLTADAMTKTAPQVAHVAQVAHMAQAAQAAQAADALGPRAEDAVRAGTGRGDGGLREILGALTQDDECHAALAGRARAFAAAHGIGADGGAAARAADAIATLTARAAARRGAGAPG